MESKIRESRSMMESEVKKLVSSTERSSETFNRPWKTKTILFAQASDGEIKKLVYNSEPRNT